MNCIEDQVNQIINMISCDLIRGRVPIIGRARQQDITSLIHDSQQNLSEPDVC